MLLSGVVDPLVSTVVEGAGIVGTSYAMYNCDTGVPAASQILRYVDAAAPIGGNGSRGAPFNTLAAALTPSGTNEVVLCVAAGHYQENLDLMRAGPKVSVVGGFDDGSFTHRSPGEHPSVIQAKDGNGTVIYAMGATKVALDGLEITGGGCQGIFLNAYTDLSTITLRNNHIHHNNTVASCVRDQGGLFIVGTKNNFIELSHNVIELNSGRNHGGGGFVGSQRPMNKVNRDGSNDGFGQLIEIAPGQAWIHHNIFRNNRVLSPTGAHGGGLAAATNALVEKNEFSGNYSAYVGGGLIGEFGGSAVTSVITRVTGNWFEGNNAPGKGSAVFMDGSTMGVVTDNIIVKNLGESAVLVDSNCSGTICPEGEQDRDFLTLVHNTIALNQGEGLHVSNATAHLYNNIFWKNGGAHGDIHSSLVSAQANGDGVVVRNHIRGSDNVIHLVNAGAFPEIELQSSIDGEGTDSLLDTSAAGAYRLTQSILVSVPLVTMTATFVPAFLVGDTFSAPYPGGTTASALFGITTIPPKDIVGQPRSTGMVLLGAYADTLPM